MRKTGTKSSSKSRFLSLITDQLSNLLYQRTVWILTILFGIGIIISLWNMSRLSLKLIESTALENVRSHANSIQIARNVYDTEVVTRLQSIEDVTVSHNYPTLNGGIPVPATFLIRLGWEISEENPGMSIKLYSEYPFSGGQTTIKGRMEDDFDREALETLQHNPTQPFWRIEELQGKSVLRYAEAQIMKPSCVACHNTHPDSPKKDWQVGDVRGVLEVVTPLDSFIQQVHQGLRGTFLTMGGLSILATIGITLVINRLRRTSQELERRVVERTAQLQESNNELVIERRKSDRLLLNILPQPIANRLKQDHQNIADWFPQVTVLFADIVGFTQLSAQISASELVQLLNDIFSGFDRLCEQYNLEKIKTIGDNYMVAAGVPTQRPDHAEAIANMALGIQQELKQFNISHQSNLNVRMGINSGPVVAGVIGTKKFIYDLWGDTVNIASRMQSHSLPGSIQVSSNTYELLKDQYRFEERGNIEVKGKGAMKTYFLLGKIEGED